MAQPKKPITQSPLRQILFEIALLFLSFSVSLNARRLFDRPVATPFGIETSSKVSPESNYFAILVIIVSTIVIFCLLRWLAKTRRIVFKGIVIALLSVSLVLGVFAPGVSRYQNNADSFHNGEQLAPSLAFTHGKVPYKDLYVLRGAGEDILTPWLSFKLFGQSIGSYFFMTAATQAIAALLFFALIAMLFKGNLEFLIASIWFTLTSYGDFFYARDIFVWISLILLISVLRTGKRRSYKLAGMGLLASVSLFYSFDRGVFLAFLLAVTVATLSFLKLHDKTFTLRKDKFIGRLRVLAAAGGGYAAGLLGALILLGASGFGSFLSTTFGQSAKYQGIIFNTPFSTLGPLTIIDWLPIIAIIALLVVVFRTAKSEWPKLSTATVIEALLLLFSIVFFRAATGRPDSGHIAYGTPILFIVLFFTSFRILRNAWPQFRAQNYTPIVAAAPVVLVFLFSFSPLFTNYTRLAQMNQAPLSSVKTLLSSPSKPDTYWETKDEQVITNYITSLTNKDDYFFDFSSDPLFYFTTKLRNPTRFSISWFADPAPLEKQMLNELRANPPKVVLYESGTYYDRPDFIPMTQRLPVVNEWLLQNYSAPMSIDGTQAKVLLRK